MNKENFQNVVKKIAVIEPMNDPLSYKFTVENNVLKVPFINSSESIKGYVQCNDGSFVCGLFGETIPFLFKKV